ncbi:SAM-dependent methyltransferase [Pseudaestuariivita atlantica]|uniref:Cyclopropane-fatty-acyl-phospholipid synthase n=1 Tax=Pseudaestuariivita atlantica TaxID=1317121 RepID=A0A0L1JPG7_9RHOB|nr:cyclopropane-fatty-acyl-phospholipid synthase family protein [Pseudaestuariivita atlantica]KNG93607.1 cyclopropane-fatty-acyl-phospholipid synthase [Pseudaestuariivita atlantica]
MWEKILDTFLRRLVTRGQLTIKWPDGRSSTYGTEAEPAAAVTLKDASIVRDLCRDPELAVGEGYVDERLVIDEGTLRDLLMIGVVNQREQVYPFLADMVYKARFSMRRMAQANRVGKAKANVAHHYDLSDDLYELFLDSDKQYSCAYWSRPGMTLEEAQLAKKRHIADKLFIEPGQHVLDIGCGWGGMALTLAQEYGARVTGVTLSEHQHAIATKRAADLGLSDKVTFRLQDYRHLDETFDRIVSVGMLEHVGAPNYGEYFDAVRDLMADDGIALIHTIGHKGPPNVTNSWIDKYIFPGAYAPSAGELMKSVDKTGLFLADMESLRLHYSYTLDAWRDRFEANIDRVREIYDDRFCRMWRFYLESMSVSFMYGVLLVYQLQLSKTLGRVPITRDYLYGTERNDQFRQQSAG